MLLVTPNSLFALDKILLGVSDGSGGLVLTFDNGYKEKLPAGIRQELLDAIYAESHLSIKSCENRFISKDEVIEHRILRTE